MHIISKKVFVEATKKYPGQKEALLDVYAILKSSHFESPEKMKQVFPSLDNFKYRDKWWVIDIGGNRLRLMAFIQFYQNRIFVKHIVSHAEYDKLCQIYRKK